MKNILILIPVLLFLSDLYAIDSTRFIEVNGIAIVKQRADQIKWKFKIKIVDSSIEISKQKNDKVLQELMIILRSISQDENDIEVLPILQGKNFIREDRKRVQNGFFTSVNINFTQRDLSKYSELVMKLSKNDYFEIVHSSFENSKYEDQHKSALKKAILAAREKAEYLAEALGLKISSVLEIHETSPFQSYPSPYNVATTVTGNTGETSGVVTISRSVRVKFSLE